MNKKLQNLSFSLLIVMLFAMLFQSVHSYEHLAKQLTSKHCDHKYDRSKNQISHTHQNVDHCFVCEYSFSSYIPVDFFSFGFKKPIQNTSYHFALTENPIVFSGSQLALRGPPSFIV